MTDEITEVKLLDDAFNSGTAFGRHQLIEELQEYARSTNNSRVMEIVYNAIYYVEKKK